MNTAEVDFHLLAATGTEMPTSSRLVDRWWEHVTHTGTADECHIEALSAEATQMDLSGARPDLSQASRR
jgi:hypothetical protein